MTIQSDKPLKQCPYCYKEVKNLAVHIINTHPSIMEKLEEETPSPSPPATPTPLTPTFQNIPRASPGGDINFMVRDKLETMLNIKLIQMLEKGATIEEVQRVMNPPPPPQTAGGLDDIKKLVEIQRLITPQHLPPVALESAETSSFDWNGLISAALPLVLHLMQSRMNKTESGNNGFDTGKFEERSPAILKPISSEIAGDTAEPRSFSEEPRNIGEAEQSDNTSNERINKWLE